MTPTTDPEKRTAAVPAQPHEGPVTLVNSFVVAPGRDEAFTALWARTSAYFRAQPGFVSLRMHRALSPDATYRYVNVAVWNSVEEYVTAHAGEEFLRLVRDPAMVEFPASPAIYEVFAEYQASAVAA